MVLDLVALVNNSSATLNSSSDSRLPVLFSDWFSFWITIRNLRFLFQIKYVGAACISSS
jgi:hypothetical protein